MLKLEHEAVGLEERLVGFWLTALRCCESAFGFAQRPLYEYAQILNERAQAPWAQIGPDNLRYRDRPRTPS